MASTGEKFPDLWSFMVKVYARPGVADACLRLQETYRLDVPLLLAVLFGRISGRELDPAAIRALDDACASWRDEVVRPLRNVRTKMKSHPWMAAMPRVPSLRESIKASELNAERIEGEMLEGLLKAFPLAAAGCTVPALAGLAADVLDISAPERSQRIPPDAQLIADACIADQPD